MNYQPVGINFYSNSKNNENCDLNNNGEQESISTVIDEIDSENTEYQYQMKNFDDFDEFFEREIESLEAEYYDTNIEVDRWSEWSPQGEETKSKVEADYSYVPLALNDYEYRSDQTKFSASFENEDEIADVPPLVLNEEIEMSTTTTIAEIEEVPIIENNENQEQDQSIIYDEDCYVEGI